MTVNVVATQEPVAETKTGMEEINEQKSVDITTATQEPVVKMEINQEGKETMKKLFGCVIFFP